MKIKNKTRILGGVVGMIFCIVLFVIYIFIENKSSYFTQKSMLLPTVTGHGLFVMAGFYAEGDNVIKTNICKQETNCQSWVSKNQYQFDNCSPYTLETGEKGCCQSYMVNSEYKCAEKVSLIIILLSGVLLLSIYFFLGYYIVKKIETREVYE